MHRERSFGAWHVGATTPASPFEVHHRDTFITMATHPSHRLVNPMLGVYFGIVASLLAGGVLTSLLLEAMGHDDGVLRAIATGLLVAIVAVLAAASWTSAPFEMFAAGRRVPAFFVGLLVAATLLGGTGLVAIPGLMFLIGFDALFLTMGMTGGLVVLAILIAPFVRKMGAYSIPALLELRFGGPVVRIVAAVVLSVPLVLLLVAELKIAMLAAGWLTGWGGAAIALPIAALVAGTLVAGGMRASGWSGAALAIVLVIGLVVSVTTVAVLEGHLPIPQLSHGETMRALARIELTQGVPVPVADPFAFALPGVAPEAISRRYATPFSTIGPVAFQLAVLAVMMGVAGHPLLVARAATTPGVYETRKSIGWAIAILGLIVLTLSAAAVIMRETVMTDLANLPAGRAPEWVARALALDLARLDEGTARLTPASLQVRRDGVLLLLHVASAVPRAILYLVMSGVVAGALVAATAAVGALGTMLAEDVVQGSGSARLNDGRRALAARAAWGGIAAAGMWLATTVPADPLELALWSLAISGSTAFPALILAVWWKRCNAWGVVVGLLTGLGVAASTLILGEVIGIGLPGSLAAIAGAPASFAAAMIVSVMTLKPNRHALEMVRDLRIPGGETLYDRELRLEQARQRRQAGG